MGNGKALDDTRDFEIADGVLVKYNGSSENVIVPDGVKIIGENAFSESESIVCVDLNEAEEVRARAFYFCRNLKKVKANNVKIIRENAFKHCLSLADIELKNVERIETQAFFGCSIERITRLDKLTYVGDSAFESNDFTELVCPNLKEFGNSVFSCCSRLKRFTVPAGITAISQCMFAGCSALKSITLPDSLERIERAAFFDCGFRRFVVPAGVKAIEPEAFARCYISAVQNLSELSVRAGNNKNGGVAMHAYAVSLEDVCDIDNGYVFCKGADGVTYLIDYDGADDKLVLPSDHDGKAYEIGCLAFESSDVTSVDIGDGVTAIGKLAFYDCKKLKNVCFGKGLKRIDRLAFKKCEGIISATLNEGLEELGVGAFLGTGLEYIVLSSTVKTIRNSVFDYCSALRKIYYTGTTEQAERIQMSKSMRSFVLSHIVYYSETPPENSDKKYWHYENSKIVEY